MKGIYINYKNYSGKYFGGVDFKIHSQIKAFNDAGLNCSEVQINYQANRFYSVLKRLPFFNVQPTWKYDNAYKDVDYIYFRRPFLMKIPFRQFLKKIKKNNKNVKIIVEIPTYPYDDEIKHSLLGNLIINYDIYNRNKLSGLVDRFTTLTNDEKIFGIKTIKIENGIDFSDYKIRSFNGVNDGTINMCAVAIFAEWHGYERIIKGLYNYYKNGGNINIVIHMVGDGPELPKYKQLVSLLKLENNFIFYGYLDKSNIAKIYDMCLVSLGTFAAFKFNLNDICNLKSTESLAYGIPFVNGCKISRFTNKGYNYLLELQNDSTDVDINKIIEFIDKIYQNSSIDEVTSNIRQFGEEHFSMKACMKEVINYIRCD